MTQHTVRLASSDDLGALTALDGAAFETGESAAPSELEMGVARKSLSVAVDGASEIIGYIQWFDTGRTRLISGIAISEASRRQGVGNDLIAAALEKRPRPEIVELTTAPDNVAMMSLASRHGLRVEEYLEDAFGHGTDRVVMRKTTHATSDLPESAYHIPVTARASLRAALARGDVATSIVNLPHGPAWRTVRTDRDGQFAAEMNESSVSVDITSVLLAALAFLLGFGFATPSFPADLLALLTLALITTVWAMLVYANVTGFLASQQRHNFARAQSIGNVLSEFGGVFPLIHVLPVALAAITDSSVAGALTCVASGIVSLVYLKSEFSILDRYEAGTRWRPVIIAWLSASPIIGFGAFELLGTSAPWSIASVAFLVITGVRCLRRSESIRLTL